MFQELETALRRLPMCIAGTYDVAKKRWFVVASRTGTVNGAYFADLLLGASASANPTGLWYFYSIDG